MSNFFAGRVPSIPGIFPNAGCVSWMHGRQRSIRKRVGAWRAFERPRGLVDFFFYLFLFLYYNTYACPAATGGGGCSCSWHDDQYTSCNKPYCRIDQRFHTPAYTVRKVKRLRHYSRKLHGSRWRAKQKRKIKKNTHTQKQRK